MITGVILARNEEHNIRECLTALKPHVSELILIDMESDDGTVSIAKPLVDKVLTHPVVPNFDVARNLAIPESSNDWLWFVDADERVSNQTGQLVRELLANPTSEFAAINIPFKTYFCGQWIEHCGWWPGYTMPRVLKKGKFRFNEELHSGVHVNGEQIFVAPDPRLGVDHHSYRSVQEYVRKCNLYTSTEAKNMSKQINRFDWQQATRSMMTELWNYYERNQGKLDGGRGWILSWLSSQYRWLSHAKLIDENPTQEVSSCPEDLDEVMEFMQSELRRIRSGTPSFPLGVRWRSPLFDPSGYAEDSRNVLKSLAAGSREIQAEEIRWNDRRCQLTAPDRSLVNALMRVKTPKNFISITTCIPTLVEPDPEATINILRTTFETDRIPSFWLSQLERFDQIWVFSEHSRQAFARSGVAPEKLVVMPQFYDSSLFRPEGDQRELPSGRKDDFVFLSIFDWQLRKGWDVLLRAYCQQFTANSGTTLLLKVTGQHGKTPDQIQREANAVLGTIHQSLELRPDIQFQFDSIATEEMPGLYRACDAFVLPTRGEGWGRPLMESMACGLPVICTNQSGNSAFAHSQNCRVVESQLSPVSEVAVQEIPFFAGHQWLEPNEDSLRMALQDAIDRPEHSQKLAHVAVEEMQTKFSLAQGTARMESAIAKIESQIGLGEQPVTQSNQPNVVLEGELFSSHSFSNINEWLTLEFQKANQTNFSVHRVAGQPEIPPHLLDQRRQAQASVDVVTGSTDVVIRHAFPPNFEKPEQGAWVHIQPWEYGPLPVDWVQPLRDDVNEIWAPSNYVKQCYLESGIPEEKIHVIPWGIDPKIFHGDAVPRVLPTQSEFRFVYVGGTIERKGFDRVLKAYLEEFNKDESVCLLVKDVGTQTFYRYGNFKDEVKRQAEDHSNPEILYTDEDMTPGQLASLYSACDCLVSPYRGEGFGMPILEGMACGLPVIVPTGGPSDDFVTEETGFFVPAKFQTCTHSWKLCGEPTELELDIDDLRRSMREAFENSEATREKGRRASLFVAQNFTWQKTVERMSERIERLTETTRPSRGASASISTVLATYGDEDALVRSMGMMKSSVGELVVLNFSGNESIANLASEYDARCFHADPNKSFHENLMDVSMQLKKDWVLLLLDGEWLSYKDLGYIQQRLNLEPGSTGPVEFLPTPNEFLIRLFHRKDVSLLQGSNGLNPQSRDHLWRKLEAEIQGANFNHDQSHEMKPELLV